MTGAAACGHHGGYAPSEPQRAAPVFGRPTAGRTNPAHGGKRGMAGTGREPLRLRSMIDMVRDICVRAGYGEPIRAEALRMAGKAQSNGLARNKRREATALACIYLAHRTQGMQVPLNRFLTRHTGSATNSGYPGKKIPRKTLLVCDRIRMLKPFLVGAKTPCGPGGAGTADVAAKILWELEGRYGRRAILSATRTLGRAKGILAGRTPQAMAAAALCLHLRAENGRSGTRRQGVTAMQKGVASACGTSGVTAGNTVNVLRRAGLRPDAACME